MNRASGGSSAETADLAALPQLAPSRLEAQVVLYRVALVALLLVGAYFRSRRYWFDPLGLWLDEATWAARLLSRSLFALEFRPIGYMAVTKLLVSIHCDERTLRFLSYAAGIASLPLTVALGRQLFASRLVRVLCLAAIALNPLLIDMAREFKPYELEFFVHLGLIFLLTNWLAKRTRARLAVLLACAVLAFPFAYNVVFLLPSLFSVLGFALWRDRAWRALAVTAGGALAALAVIGAVWFAALRGMASDTDGTEQFWGDKYHVFYRAEDAAQPPRFARSRWVVGKYVGLTAFPSGFGIAPVGNELLDPVNEDRLARVTSYGWLVLHAVGLFALFRSRRRELAVLVGPLLLTILFNRFGLWPFGVFRTNVFLLAYFVLIPMFGLELLSSQRWVLAWLGGALGCALLLTSTAVSGRDLHERKHFFATQTEIRALLEQVRTLRAQQPPALRKGKSVLLLDGYSCAAFSFFIGRQDGAREPFDAFLNDELEHRCPKGAGGIRAALRDRPGRPFFVVSSDARARSALFDMLQESSTVLAEANVRDTHRLYFVKSHGGSRSR